MSELIVRKYWKDLQICFILGELRFRAMSEKVHFSVYSPLLFGSCSLASLCGNKHQDTPKDQLDMLKDL